MEAVKKEAIKRYVVERSTPTDAECCGNSVRFSYKNLPVRRNRYCTWLRISSPISRRNTSITSSTTKSIPLDTCVSYSPDTTTRQIRHLSDTKSIATDTKSVECPYLASTVRYPDPGLKRRQRYYEIRIYVSDYRH